MFSYWLLCIVTIYLTYMPIPEDLPTHHVTQMDCAADTEGLDKISYLYVSYSMSVNKRYFTYREVFSSFGMQNFGGDYTLITWHLP
jgi:hypothetical protein